MDTEDITKKLQRAYHSMVDVLDDLTEKDLIEQEGKSLKEAVELAQLKLSDWKELTREEVEKVSTEVKQDLSSLGETLYEARQVIREKLALDAEYLKETSLDKLNQIADKAALELAQFREDLREKVEDVTEDEYETEHHEHQQWDSEHAMWLDDIAVWEKEHQEAEEKLLVIKDRIHQQGVALQEHAQTIRAHQARDHEHETVLADAERDLSNESATDKEAASEKTHEQIRHVHENHASFHQKIKQQHKEAMVLINQLYKQIKAST